MASLRLPLVLLIAAVLVVPATAVGQRTNAPPGNSGIDEYLETVPGATGNKVPRNPGSKGRSALTPAQRARLERLGRDGRSVAAVVDATTPRSERKGGGAGSRTTPLPDAAGRSPLDKAVESLGGSDNGDGLGVLLPAILLAALLGTLALVLLRRRSASS